ncbi:MAG: radical SAM protein [Spirochaetia bacterium]
MKQSIVEPERSMLKGDVKITLNKRGEDVYVKSRHPVIYGVYSEVKTSEAVFRFNLNGEIIGAKGLGSGWPNPSEQLKRTAGNDWVYYSTGGFSGTYERIGEGELSEPIRFKIPSPYNEVYKATGEYYLPNVPYESNSVLGGDPFNEPAVEQLITSWYAMLQKNLGPLENASEPFRRFIGQVLSNTPEKLQRRAEELFALNGGRVNVLPPGARHVDYNLIPLSVAEGCLYKCPFCRVKTERPFETKAKEDIEKSIDLLSAYYGRDLINYNALFLGDQDALNADKSTVLRAAERAISKLKLNESYMKGCSLFMFGSVDSFLSADYPFFDKLNALGCTIYINLGFESADQETLDYIGKPITAEKVDESFAKMTDINEIYENIEITGNFLMGDTLPDGHYPSFLRLVREKLDRPRGKGTVYLSPLIGSRFSRSTLFEFNQLKRLSRLPAFLYTIQRL